MSNTKVRYLQKLRSEILRDYQAETGATNVSREDLLAYIERRKDHPLHRLFFDPWDDETAHELRLRQAAALIADGG